MSRGTLIEIDGPDFLINGELTYAGRRHEGRRIEGLLLNSRMVQGIFDDENPATAPLWAYPDTGIWDAERNTAEFCAALPLWRSAGLLAVTVGLQGGGPNYTEGVYEQYINTAFHPDGTLKPAYFARLKRILEAADAVGMVVIVNYFYWRQNRFEDDAAVLRATRLATEWLLQSGHRNVLVDINNEIREGDGILASRGIHRLLQAARETTLEGRRLLIGTSTFPTNHMPAGDWPRYCDFLLPHGNDSQPAGLRQELRDLRSWDQENGYTRPIMINEDSTDLGNLEAALDEGVSWGYFDQGYGCGYKHLKLDWSLQGRETTHAELSGFQTPPINWGINTPEKRAFFRRVAEVTGELSQLDWDRQIIADSEAGRLDTMINRALDDYSAGRTTEI